LKPGEIKMKRLLPLMLVLLLLAVVLCLAALAGEIEPKFAGYLETIGDDDFASAIIFLQDRPDIRGLDAAMHAEHAPLKVRHEQVLGALTQAAERSQPALLSYLDTRKATGTVEGYTPYWITNMVVVYATKAELERIAERGDVEAVEANFRATLIEAAERPYLGSPTLGIGVTASLRAINADRVWYELGYTGAGTLVANLDTGVDGDHPALTDRWRGNWHPWSECWRDALGGGTTYPEDSHGHGTHTMGTMCGAGHATGDTVGVAFDALWIADNAINQSVGPEFDNDVLEAFQWFADPDGNPGTTDDVPDVLQNSWGIDSRFGYDYADCDYRWQEAIENCEAAGVVVTFSAGNEGPSAQTNRSPANICNTPTVNFSVGAVDCEAYDWPYPIAYFSSRGPSDCDGVTIKPEVSAPGVSVYSSYPGGGYARMSGTSMAGPHVAGVVALMRQANPDADVQTIKTVLMQTARDLGSTGEDNDYGWGVIDAYQAVLAVMQPDTEPPVVAVTAPNGGEVLTVGSAYTVAWTATDNVGVTSTSIYYSYDGGANYGLVATLPGNPGSYAWTVPNTPSTQCLVEVYAYDAAANEGWDVSDAFFTIEELQAPYVWVPSIDLSLSQKGPNTEAVAEVLVWDEDNQPVKGAQVSSHWGGLSTDSDVFTTKRKGTGSCTSDKLKNPVGWWYYYIDDVTVSGYVFRTDIGEVSDAIYAGGIPLAASAPDRMSVTHLSADDGSVEFSVGTVKDTHVSFALYNVAGQRVKTLLDDNTPAGYRTLVWDGTDENGVKAAAGIYFYRVVSGNEVLTDKLMLVR
jgi:subtilisin family serine protease